MTTGSRFTDEELEQLTDEEREGLLETEGEPENEDEDQEAGTVVAEHQEQRKGGEQAGPRATGQEEGDKQPPAAADTTNLASEQRHEEPRPAAAPQPGPAMVRPTIPNWEAPADANEKLDDIKRRQDDLDTKFDDGAISAKEYRAESRALGDEADALRSAVLKADLSLSMRKDHWFNSVVPEFLTAHDEYEPGSALHRMLDHEVRKLQVASSDDFDPSILIKAHEAVQSQVRRLLGSAEVAKPVSESKPKPDPKALPIGERVIPPTLAGVPVSDLTGAGDGGKFAYLDRLADSDPLAYEEALGKMTDAERDAYLAAA